MIRYEICWECVRWDDESGLECLECDGSGRLPVDDEDLGGAA